MSKKTLTTAVAVVLALAIAVGGTLAYLQDTTPVETNDFRADSVEVDLTETDGTYRIVPGFTQTKDPKITASWSLPSLLFVQVTEDVEYVDWDIADGWTEVTGYPGVYYRALDGTGTNQDFYVLKDNKVTYNSAPTSVSDGTLSFQAYIIQRDKSGTVGADGTLSGMTEFDAAEAWGLINGKASSAPATLTATLATPVTLSVPVAAGDNKQTTVTIPDGVAIPASLRGDITLKVDTEGDGDFTITGDNSTATEVATIDVELLKNGTAVSTDENRLASGYYTVVTYIQKNLTDVSLKYGDENWTSVDTITADKQFIYEPATGKLTFSTSHFSEFVVSGIPAAAKIGNTTYTTLTAAIDSVADNNTSPVTIELLCDVKDGAGLSTNTSNADGHPKNIIIDFGGHTYDMSTPTVGSDGTKSQAMHWCQGSTIVMQNGTFICPSVAKMALQNYADLTIKDMTIDVSAIPYRTYSGLSSTYARYNGKEIPTFNNNSTTAKMTIEDSTLIFNDACSFSVNTMNELTLNNVNLNKPVTLNNAGGATPRVTLLSGTNPGFVPYFDDDGSGNKYSVGPEREGSNVYVISTESIS